MGACGSVEIFGNYGGFRELVCARFRISLGKFMQQKCIADENCWLFEMVLLENLARSGSWVLEILERIRFFWSRSDFFWSRSDFLSFG